MPKSSFEERRKALEDAFFNQQDEKLLNRLREKEDRQALTEVSGIQNEAALDALFAAGVTASTLAALSVVPLVFVAWADRLMSERERKAVLAAAREANIAEGSEAYHLIDGWLANRPPTALFEAWKEFARETIAKLDRVAGDELRASVLDRANKVAEATGGFLNVATVSKVERETIAQIDKALS